MSGLERADGGSATSQAADLTEGAWHRNTWAARSVRLLVFAVPLVASIGATRFYTTLIDRPSGMIMAVGYWTGALAISIAVMVTVDRQARRLAPLGALFRLSLVFPDEAPSRFRIAMRSGTARKFQQQVERGEHVEAGDAAAALLGLVAQVSRHDRLTRGHSERVRAYTDMLSEELGLPEPDRDKLRWAALVHDVGKISVPEHILNKPGRPDDDEWAILRGHPGAAAPLVEPLRPWLGDWVSAATQHHERYDGQGYPLGLAGDDITLAGRIVAVADAYDVMTAVRSYKKPLSPSLAREELARNAWTHFDPAVVRAMLSLSMGRLRMVVGPLGWLNELAWIARVPHAATAAATTATAALAVTAGVAMSTPPPPDPSIQPVERTVDEAIDHVAPSDTRGPAEDASATAPDSTTTSTSSADATLAVSTTTSPTSTTSPESSLTTSTSVAPATTTKTPTTTTTKTTTTTTTKTTTTTTTTTTTAATPPTANDDSVTWEDGGVADVIANDVRGSAPLDPPSLRIVSPPAFGLASVTGTHRILFDPDDGEGTTSLVYEICDENTLCDQATLTIAIDD